VLLLDTDVLLDVQRGHPAALAWFASLTELPSVPALVMMELIQGAQSESQVRAAQNLVRPLPIVWPTLAECKRALADFTVHYLSHGLGLLDALLAEMAIGLSAELCTFNSKHYANIPGLAAIEPYTRSPGGNPRVAE
jgi:predicted nucleic acid-binding protein